MKKHTYKKYPLLLILVLTAASFWFCTTEAMIGGAGTSPAVIYKATNPKITYNANQIQAANNISVTITNQTQGSVIYYTTDNSDPRSSNTAVVGISPININVVNGTTVKAFSRKGGFLDSSLISVKCQTNNQNIQVAKPTLNIVNPNANGNSWVIELKTTTNNAIIKFTQNGDNPFTSNQTIQGNSPLTKNVPKGAIIKAYAFKQGMNDSELLIYTLPN